MRAVSCIIAAATALAWVAGSARAQSADPPVVKKAVKASKDKAKPDKNLILASEPGPRGADAQFQYGSADQSERALHGGGFNRSAQHLLILRKARRCAMVTSRIWFTAAQKAELWERWKNGKSVVAISRALEKEKQDRR